MRPALSSTAFLSLISWKAVASPNKLNKILYTEDINEFRVSKMKQEAENLSMRELN
jgi:hypothetical protein